MSRWLRQLLEEIAETIEGEKAKHTEGAPEAPSLNFEGLAIRYDGEQLVWNSPQGNGRKHLTKSRIKAVIRSLLSNQVGRVAVGGFEHVSFSLSAKEVVARGVENEVIAPVDQVQGGEKICGEDTSHYIRQKGIRKYWDAVFRLLEKAESVRICLSEKGKELIEELKAWEDAKKEGVPLSRALDNENLSDDYLKPSERREPGRFRSRGLYKEKVEGETYYGKSDLIVKGTPPEMADEHDSNTGRIRRTLSNMEVRSEHKEAAHPVSYVEDPEGRGPNQFVVLENGMRVDVQSILFVRRQFPDATWTTAHYENTQSNGFGNEGSAEKVESTFVVVVDDATSILASVVPYKGIFRTTKEKRAC